MVKNSSNQTLLEQIQEKLRKNGYKLTGPRQAIINFLVHTDNHPNIDDLFSEVSKDYPGIGVATVYRTLELLRQLNIVHTLELPEDRQRYEINLPEDHHHHLVCTNCNRIVEFGNCNFKHLVEEIESSTRFQIHSHSTIAYGLCPHCSISN